jgi:hypothetical protein
MRPLRLFLGFAVSNATSTSPTRSARSTRQRGSATEAALPVPYNRFMTVFHEKRAELDHFETMMGLPRGRLAVTMDMITDAMAFVGQHGVYCQSQRQLGKPAMDIQIIMKNLTDAKELIQSVMEELRK